MERLAGLDDTQWGAVVAKGWDKLDPGPALLASMNTEAQLRSQLTIPPEEIARVPKDPASPDWAPLYERLGKPKDASAYDFADVKRGGQPLPADEVEYLRGLAHELHLSVPAAKALAEKHASYADGLTARAMTQNEARTGAEMAKLDAMWGGQKDANMYLANEAMAVLKLPAEVVTAFRGNSDTMEAMRNLGVRMQEAKYVGGGGNGGGVNDIGRMTAPQAQARLEELKRDQGWLERWMKGGADEIRQLGDLTRVIVGQPQR